MSPLAPLIKYWSTSKRAARVIARVLTDEKTGTGVFFGGNGKLMVGSVHVREPEFQDRVVTQTRAQLGTVPQVRLGSFNPGSLSLSYD